MANFVKELHSPVPYSRPSTPGAHPVQIGFVGIGAMGYFMARNLATHQHPGPSTPLLIWNRTPERALKLAKEIGEDRIRIAHSLEQVATECDVIGIYYLLKIQTN